MRSIRAERDSNGIEPRFWQFDFRMHQSHHKESRLRRRRRPRHSGTFKDYKYFVDNLVDDSIGCRKGELMGDNREDRIRSHMWMDGFEYGGGYRGDYRGFEGF